LELRGAPGQGIKLGFMCNPKLSRSLRNACTILCVVQAFLQGLCQGQVNPAPSPPNAPDLLPGRGLAEHDFFYAGEAKEERMFIVRQGAVVWSYTHPGKGEISDAILLPNGHVFFAHQFGVTEVSQDKKVVWNYDAPPNTEIHTAQPLDADRVWFVQNGDPAKFIVLNKASRTVDREFVLPVKNPKSIHGQFRHARLTDQGTLLIAHMDLGRAVEYSLDGKELWSVDVPGIWSATPLSNGHVLAVSNRGFVRELSRDGRAVWEWSPADAPEYKSFSLQLATRLANGNTVINNWFNQWSGHLDLANPPVQALEITPAKKVVWALRSWSPPADLGPATTLQFLKE
jgi:outer membrane protein assembly factor BamB